MVKRLAIGLALWLTCLSGWAQTQMPVTFKATVDNTEVHMNRHFTISLDYSGTVSGDFKIPESEGLTIFKNLSQNLITTNIVSTPNGLQRINVKQFKFTAQATKTGTVIIPPIEATIDGIMVKTKPIVLRVLLEHPADKYAIHLWVSRTSIQKNQWFWIYLQATGRDVQLPTRLDIEGLEISPAIPESNSIRSSRGRRVQTYKRGYRVRSKHAGPLLIPSQSIKVDNKLLSSNSLELTILDEISTATNSIQKASTPQKTTDTIKLSDAIFVTMDVDRREVYLGEPIMLTTQLWQLQSNTYSAGRSRSNLDTPPSMEGFYVSGLEPIQFEAYHGALPYHVTEQRKILYPTKTGELTIGQWTYEGDIISGRSLSKYYEEHGPYTIKVNPLPKPPPGFSGAVGEYEVTSKLSSTQLKAGVPVTLDITLRGKGNADAIGAPKLPAFNWAHASGPERREKEFVTFGQLIPGTTKTFTFTLTPTDAGKQIIPAFEYAVFNPVAQQYTIETIGPFTVRVEQGDDAPTAMLLPEDSVDIAQSTDLIQGEIHPLLPAPSNMKRAPVRSLWILLVFLIPPIVYAFTAYRMKHLNRMESDVGYARAHSAKLKGIKRLENVLSADDATDELFRAMVEYIGDTLNVSEQGLTSAEVKELLEKHSVAPALCHTITRLLKSCERERYAAQALSKDELRALLQAAESALNDFDAHRNKGAGS